MLIVAAISILDTLAFEHLSLLPSLQAQQTSNAGDFVLFAGVRRDTEKNQSFIFHNPKTGEIWVYEDVKVTDHYRIIKVGENLEKAPVKSFTIEIDPKTGKEVLKKKTP